MTQHPGDEATADLTRQPDRLDEQLGIRTYTTTNPIRIKAVQLTEDADWEAIATWCGGRVHTERDISDEYDSALVIPGIATAVLDDWVIQGVTGSFFVRSPEEFAATYTPAPVEHRAPEVYRFDGDHWAIDTWATQLVIEHTGERPDMSVFEGDCRGLYINPKRLAEIGLGSTLSGTVHVAHGDSVAFENGEFARVLSQHEASVVLCHYGAEGGYPASGFVYLLLVAMDGADAGNLARFRAGWPGLATAVDLAKNHRGGIERLQAIAAGQQVTR